MDSLRSADGSIRQAHPAGSMLNPLPDIPRLRPVPEVPVQSPDITDESEDLVLRHATDFRAARHPPVGRLRLASAWPASLLARARKRNLPWSDPPNGDLRKLTLAE